MNAITTKTILGRNDVVFGIPDNDNSFFLSLLLVPLLGVAFADFADSFAFANTVGAMLRVAIEGDSRITMGSLD
jgi:hypothetical protein